MMNRRVFAALGLVACLALTGCGEKSARTVKLGGTVTLDGKPLAEGFIMFHPSDKEGGASVSATIIDGKYSAPVVPVGSYRVAFKSGAAPVAQSGPIDSTYNAPTGKEKKDPIPDKYHKPSLPADASADNLNLNFDLKSS